MLIQGTGPYHGNPGFDRGMQTTMYCGNDPESWVRGSASLDTDSGIITVTVNLETDSTEGGPKGKVQVTVKDAAGNTLATISTPEVGMGGKDPGTFASRNFSATDTIPVAKSQQAASLWVEAQCTGSIDQWFGIDLGQLTQAFKLIISVVGG